ncbi:MAG: hypothetical protein GEV06_09230 [Luteitalea sp.]|nr:hypothetical protein [Luteitalea sp.]
MAPARRRPPRRAGAGRSTLADELCAAELVSLGGAGTLVSAFAPSVGAEDRAALRRRVPLDGGSVEGDDVGESFLRDLLMMVWLGRAGLTLDLTLDAGSLSVLQTALGRITQL